MPAVGWPSNRRFFFAPAALPIYVRVRSASQPLITEREVQTGFGATMRGAILKSERAAVGFGDLPAQNQTDSRASLLGCEKWHEKIRGAGNSWAVILNPHFDASVLAFPSHAHAAARFQRGVHGVVQQIDQ